MEGDFTLGGEQHTDDVLQNCTPETSIILLSNATLVFNKKVKKKITWSNPPFIMPHTRQSILTCYNRNATDNVLYRRYNSVCHANNNG